MTGDKKKPGLDKDDLDLWRQVTENLKPLPDKVRNRDLADAAEKAGAVSSPGTPPPKPAKRKSTPIRPASPKVILPAAPKPTAMETRRIRRLARGVTSFDAKIDLHGMTQKEAHSRLLLFLKEAKYRGNRNVLVVTGKGRAGNRSPEPGREAPGVIRRNIGHWLNEPIFAELVVAWSPARQHHGGDGALYVQVRRARD
jgi:DNA-nicking Smr family endonuclease